MSAMNPPQPASWPEVPAPKYTPARPSPVPKGAVVLFLLPVAASYALGLDAGGFVRRFRETDTLVLVAVALVFLLAAMSLGRWGYRFMLSKKRPSEPWLWDRTWRRELIDQQLGQVVARWIFGSPFLGFLVLLHYIAYTTTFSQGHVAASIFLALFILLFDTILFTQLVKPAALETLALLRFGRMRLRLPKVPLELGSRCKVHLVARPGLTSLPEVKVQLRRKRQWSVLPRSSKSGIRTFTDAEYTHTQTVSAEALREGRDLAIPLELPEGGPEHSTVLNAEPHCFWELQLSSEVPGVDLDVTFVLPVYYTVDENHTVLP